MKSILFVIAMCGMSASAFAVEDITCWVNCKGDDQCNDAEEAYIYENGWAKLDLENINPEKKTFDGQIGDFECEVCESFPFILSKEKDAGPTDFVSTDADMDSFMGTPPKIWLSENVLKGKPSGVKGTVEAKVTSTSGSDIGQTEEYYCEQN